MRLLFSRTTLVVLALSAGAMARAEEEATQCPCFFHQHFRQYYKKKAAPGTPRCIPHTDERAGFPRELAAHVEPTNTPGGIGYYVGGGVSHARGYHRHWDQGVWGWDETGMVRHRPNVILGWSMGRKYQGGTGAYRTDGPVVPDIIYTGTTIANSIGRREEGEGEGEGGGEGHAGGAEGHAGGAEGPSQGHAGGGEGPSQGHAGGEGPSQGHE
jgi:hypothetical protein